MEHRQTVELGPDCAPVQNPEMWRRLELLACPVDELAARKEAALVACCLLDAGEPSRVRAPAVERTPPVIGASRDERRLVREEWKTFSVASLRRDVPRAPRSNASTSLGDWEHRVAERPSLLEGLVHQVDQEFSAVAERRLARRVLEMLSPEGFLEPGAVERLVVESGASVQVVADLIGRIQRLDPVGLATTSSRESLLVQAQVLFADDRTLQQLVERHLDLFLADDPTALQAALGVDEAELQRTVARLRRLDPRPGLCAVDERALHVTPDATIARGEQGLTVTVEDEGPALRLHPKYVKLLDEGGGSARDRRFLRAQLAEASNFLRGLEERAGLLQRIVTRLATVQQAHLLSGAPLRPLTQQDLAREFGVDESTLSRAVKDKYVATPRGTMPLRALFARPVGAITEARIHQHLRDLIATESPARPLSDDALRRLLEEQHGVALARRTVAKYREALGIPGSLRRLSRPQGRWHAGCQSSR